MMELLVNGLENFEICKDRINIIKINSLDEYRRIVFSLENRSESIKIVNEGMLQKYYLLSTLFQYDISKKVRLKLIKYFEEHLLNLNSLHVLKAEEIYKNIGIDIVNDRFNINIESNFAIKNFLNMYSINLDTDFSSVENCIETISQGLEILNDEYSVVVVYGIFDLLSNYDIMILCRKITSKKIRVLLIDYNSIDLDFFIKNDSHIVIVESDFSQISNI